MQALLDHTSVRVAERSLKTGLRAMSLVTDSKKSQSVNTDLALKLPPAVELSSRDMWQ